MTHSGSSLRRSTRRCLVLATFFLTLLLCTAALPIENRTLWGDRGINTYAKIKHGPDGALFLDPYLMFHLLNLEGQVLLDAGCGAGPWSVIAAKNGAFVYGIDIQKGMIEKSEQAAREAQVEDKTNFVVGDVAKLPYPNDFFDQAISINVGCNLPLLESHLQELHRVLKKGGKVIIAAPSSFGTVFTNGKRTNEEVVNTIDQLLDQNQEIFPEPIQKLDEVYRATFVKKLGKWSLVQDETQLEPGEAIYRKIPMMWVPNHYHSESEYLYLFLQEGFRKKKIYHPRFFNEQEREGYNENQMETLGKEYVEFSPFVIFIVEKF